MYIFQYTYVIPVEALSSSSYYTYLYYLDIILLFSIAEYYVTK